MSPKLDQTYPHIVENQGITMASLEIDTYHEKVLPNQFEIHIFATVKTKMALLFCCNHLLLSVTFSVNKNKPNSEKVKFDKDFN